MRTDHFSSFDGTRLAVHTLGEGRPVLMLHGFLASAQANWIAPGFADALASAGFQVIAPDLRGHGGSDAPEDPAAWPMDVLPMDQEALIAHLGLTDYDLVGYSLGARTAARMMIRGAAPRRAVLGGMGATGIMQAGARAAMFEDGILHGENARDPRSGKVIQRMLTAGGLKPKAMLGVLGSFAPTSEGDLATIAVPTLAISGEKDDDNGPCEDLARILPRCEARRIAGDHMTAVTNPALAEAIVGWLS